jgi:hypothetical protein
MSSQDLSDQTRMLTCMDAHEPTPPSSASVDALIEVLLRGFGDAVEDFTIALNSVPIVARDEPLATQADRLARGYVLARRARNKREHPSLGT